MVWDDAILRALRELDPEVGGLVRLPPGETYVVDSIDLSAVWGDIGFGSDARVWFDYRGATLQKLTPAEGGAVDHMFHDKLGRADRVRWLCGAIDMRRDGFTPGVACSAWFLHRSDDWQFFNPEVRDSIEEGIKAWKPVRLIIHEPVLTNIRNNGIEVHAPSESSEGFRGVKPNRDAEYIRVLGGHISLVDDGAAGALDGEAVVFHGTDPNTTVRDAIVSDLRITDCLRGCWAEFDQAGQHGEHIHFRNITHENTGAVPDAIHGAALIGCRDSSIEGGVFRNIGQSNRMSGVETFGVAVSGTRDLRSENCVITDVRIEDTRTSGDRTQYGILLRQCSRVQVVRPHVRGVTVKQLWVDPDSAPPVTGRIEHPKEIRYRLALDEGRQRIPPGRWTRVTSWDRAAPLYDGFGVEADGATRLIGTRRDARHGEHDPVPGRKLLRVRVTFAPDGGGRRGVRVSRHGSEERVLEEQMMRPTLGARSTLELSVEEDLQLGDGFEVHVFQDADAALVEAEVEYAHPR